VPVLSTFSFVHGLLVGAVAVVFVTSDSLLSGGPGEQEDQQQQQQQQQQPGQQHGGRQELRQQRGGYADAGGAQALAAVAAPGEAGAAAGYSARADRALRAILEQPQLYDVLHDPEVAAALADIRQDIDHISKYRGNSAVMAVFQSLLEIEGLLEELE
jgi:hypothetical protein